MGSTLLIQALHAARFLLSGRGTRLVQRSISAATFSDRLLLKFKNAFVEFCYGAETLGDKFYVRVETLHLLQVFCTVHVLVHSAALLSTRSPSHISDDTDTVV
jgi:hypothetical protein